MQLRKNIQIEKKGVNHVRTIVEDAKCIFHQMQLENDYGIDAIIELTKNGKTAAVLIAVQIKSGKSFCSKNQCHIKSDQKHFEYWSKYPLPIVGIVYDPNEQTAYWYDIKFFLKKDRIESGPYTLSFNKNDYTRFDKKSFRTFFLTAHLRTPLKLNFQTSVKYTKSDDHDIFHIGVYSLLKNHIRLPKTWDILFQLFRSKPAPGTHGELIDLLSSIIDHHNMWWYGGYTRNLPFEEQLKKKMSEFTKDDVTKMLSFIYEEDEFTRIHISKRINDILSLIPNHKDILREIVKDKEQTVLVRSSALMFLGFYEQRKILPYLKTTIRHSPELKEKIEYIRSYFKRPDDGMWCFD